jgi:RNA polymerase sigma-54 factor
MQSRQSLQLRQQQQLTLTPQLQQSIRVLQLSSYDLAQEVAQALSDNPLLEREDDYDTEGEAREYAADEGIDESSGMPDQADSGLAEWGNGRRRDDDDFDGPELSADETLHDHLLQQLRLTRATERDQALVRLLIDELDENGYLAIALDELAATLPPEFEVEPDEWQSALCLLQSFDPPGVGARSMIECLDLQLRLLRAHDDPEIVECARRLVARHLDLLAVGNMSRLQKVLAVSPEILRLAHQRVLALDPKPGRRWAQSVADSIRPEIVVRKVGGVWQARLNAGVMPRLRVNPAYEQWLSQGKAQEGGSELVAQLQQAHGLIKSVAQRFDTVLRVARFITRHQQAFFEQGVQALRPLVLRDIAEDLEVHESTVSRATRHKYMQTPWGVFELKYFLGSALGGSGLAEAASATAVRAMIREMVGQEPPGKPLSDSKLADRLAEKGIDVARRTVAKYRELEGIETASVRKARAELGRLE